MGKEIYIVQNLLFRHIAEVHTFHHNVTGELRISQRAVTVGMLPGPVTGVLRALCQVAVSILLHIDQGHITVVFLRLFVHQLKDPLCAGQCHNDGVDLVGDLVDGHIKLPGQGHKGHQAAQRQQRHGLSGQHAKNTANDSQDRILDIAQVIVDGTHHIGKFACRIGVLTELIIELIELFLADLFVVKDLDHFLTGDHLFNIAVYSAQGFLLTDKELCRFTGQKLRGKDHAKNSDHGNDGQDPGLYQHSDKDHHQGHHSGHCLRNGLGDHLPQGVDIAGIPGHNVAGSIAVEITDRQGLHFTEQIIPDFLLNTLGHANHQIALQEVGKDTHKEDASQFYQEVLQRYKIHRTGADHRQNELIHQRTQSSSAPGADVGCRKNTNKNRQNGKLILQHIPEDPEQGLFGVLGLTTVTPHFYRGHYSSPPFF